MSEHSEKLELLATALSDAQGEFSAIPKTETNPFFRSKYAGLPKVVEVASPILAKHGLSVSQHMGADEVLGDTLTTWLLHNSGQYIKDTMRLHLVDSKGQPKIDPQAQGAATTYARRYSYMAVLGLVADEDNDAQAATRSRFEETTSVPRVPTARAARPTSATATAKQKGLINGKAGELKLTAIALANIVLSATGNPEREFESEAQAQRFLSMGMDRLPASAVDDVLAGIAQVEAAA